MAARVSCTPVLLCSREPLEASAGNGSGSRLGAFVGNVSGHAFWIYSTRTGSDALSRSSLFQKIVPFVHDNNVQHNKVKRTNTEHVDRTTVILFFGSMEPSCSI